jgi:hypothetical protein
MTKMNMFVHIVHHVSMETGDDGYWPFMEPRKRDLKAFRCILCTLPEVKVPLVRSSFSDPNHDGVADTLKLSVVGAPGGGVQKWIDSLTSNH